MSSRFTEATKLCQPGKQALVPSRLRAALLVIERIREHPSLDINCHLVRKNDSIIHSQNVYGSRVYKRLNLEPGVIDFGNHTSNLFEWGQFLLDAIAAEGFAEASPLQRESILSAAQLELAKSLRFIIESEPLEVELKNQTAEATIQDLLLAADGKGKAGDVARYLVGAMLALRFKREIPILPAYQSNRRQCAEKDAALGSFEIRNAVIEVNVEPVDQTSLKRIADALEKTDKEVWLLTRSERVSGWQNEIENADDIDSQRVIVTSVEAFLGQNITELAEFSGAGKAIQLKSLFDVYNCHWIERLGTLGIRVVFK